MLTYYNYVEQLSENNKQWEAFTKPGHTVVIAGPGSGKTHVLALKIASLLREHIVPPHGIACLTYTRMMAKELETRLWSLGVSMERPNIVISTVHGFCLGQVVQPYAQLYELDLPLPIRIVPSSVAKSCFAQVWYECYGILFDSENRTHRTRKTDWEKYRRQHTAIPYSEWENHEFGDIYVRYKRYLFQEKFVDFDIIIEEALGLIIKHDLVRQSIYSRFPWIAVDEYQDLGYPLFRIVTELINHTPIRLFAIGDPNQAIFDFAGTDPKYLYELADRSDVQPVITLNKNYRSTKEIIDISKVILPPYSEYEAVNQTESGQCQVYEYRPHWERNNQSQMVIQVIRSYQARDTQLERIAVLHRWRSGVNSLADKLDSENIDYILDKHPLYDRSMTLIRWFEDIGYWCLRGWSNESSRTVVFEDLLITWLDICGLERDSDEASAARMLLTSTLWNLKDQDILLRDWLISIGNSLDLEAKLETYSILYPDEVEEFRKLQEISQVNGQLSDLYLSKFSNVAGGVQLITLHSSKGMEFDIVIIAGVESIENDANGRRLLYVGATRAKYEINLLYNKWDWDTRSRTTPKYIEELLQKCSDWDFFFHHPSQS